MFEETNTLITKATELIKEFSQSEYAYHEKIQTNLRDIDNCTNLFQKLENMKKAASIIDTRTNEMSLFNRELASYIHELNLKLGKFKQIGNIFDHIDNNFVTILISKLNSIQDEFIKNAEYCRQLTQIEGAIGKSAVALSNEFETSVELFRSVVEFFEKIAKSYI